MKIFFIGSDPDNNWDRTPGVEEKRVANNQTLWAAAAALGAEAAKRGHTIIVGSERRTTIDYYIINDGLIPVAKNNPDKRYFMEISRPDDRKRPFNSISNLLPNISAVYTTKEVLTKSQDLWLIAHHSAIASADIVIAIGGDQGTERAVHLADELGTPILPIATFDGGAKKGYDKFRTKLEASIINISVLNSEWNIENSKKIIDIAESIGRHSYFLSHSHKDIEWCDLIHLALYEQSRIVLRDHNQLIAGQLVQEKLELAIQKSTTFILLWSKNSNKSPWCQKELQMALDNHKKGGMPKRIVLLLKDKTPLPDEVSAFFQLSVVSRTDNFSAIKDIVKTENAIFSEQ